LAPHAAGSLPPLHTLFWQQPTHVVGPQSEVQLPATHLSAPLHTRQLEPFAPHADCWVPDTHWLPWQQPDGQALAVQVHSPATQSRPEPHATHAPPSVPHSDATSPAWQSPCESQQPLQFDGPQFCDWVAHWPLRQACCEAHCAQVSPPVPQEVWALPGWQLPLASQHPLHVLGEQATVAQAPAWHCSPFAHCLHAPPPAPHAAALVPGMQLLL